MLTLDLNGDVGEGCDDADFLPLLSTASIACGGHAGDEVTMRASLRLAARLGVSVGAHPGLPDRAGFGRRAAAVTPDSARELVARQVATLARLAAETGCRLGHVKPHGELYNRAMRDDAIWEAIAAAVAETDRSLVLVGLAGPGSAERERIASALGIRAVRELFADRAYEGGGALVSRDHPGAVLHDAGVVTARLRRYLRVGGVETVEGTFLPLEARTICLHGDNPAAVDLAKAVRRILVGEGVRIEAFAP